MSQYAMDGRETVALEDTLINLYLVKMGLRFTINFLRTKISNIIKTSSFNFRSYIS